MCEDTFSKNAPRAIKSVSAHDAAWLVAEFDALRRVTHPNIARVHELLRVDRSSVADPRFPQGSTWLVEEHVDGAPLDSFVRAHPSPFDVSEWLGEFGEQLSRALAVLHAEGIVHGDVKPENVVCVGSVADVRSRVVLIDFGLSRPFGRIDRVSGTPGYLAPEAWLGEATERTDLYALGATLVRAAASRARAEQGSATLLDAVAHRHADVSIPSNLESGLRELLGRLCARDPRDRPASALAAAEEFAALRSPAHRSARDASHADRRASTARLHALPIVGFERVAAEGAAQLTAHGVCNLAGPRLAGVSSAAREVARAFQASCHANGSAVPTFLSRDTLPDESPTFPTVVHVTQASLADAHRAVAAAQIAGVPLYVVIESHSSSNSEYARANVLPLETADVLSLYRMAFPAAREPDASWLLAAKQRTGFFAGRLVHAFAGFENAKCDPSAKLAWDSWSPPDSDSDVAGNPAERRLLLTLAIAGGTLSCATVERLMTKELDAVAVRRLCRDGVVHIDEDGAYSVGTSTRDRVLASASANDRRATAKLVHPHVDTDATRAYVAGCLGEESESEDAFRAAITDARERGMSMRAARLAGDAMQLHPNVPAFRFERADALRACGDYREAFETLGPDEVGACLWLKSELARLVGEPLDPERVLKDAARAAECSERMEALAARTLLAQGAGARACKLASALQSKSSDAAVRVRAAEVLLFDALSRNDARSRENDVSDALAFAMHQKQAMPIAQAHSLAATSAHHRRDYETARSHAERAVHFADAAGERHSAATFRTNLGLIELDAGTLSRALPALRKSATVLFELGSSDVPRALYNAANAACLVGNRNVAHGLLARLTELDATKQDTELAAHARMLASDVALHQLAIQEAIDALGTVPSSTSASLWPWCSRRAALALEAGEAFALPTGAPTSLVQGTEELDGSVDQAIVRAVLVANDGDLENALSEYARVHAQFDALPFDARLRAASFGWTLSQRTSNNALSSRFAAHARAFLEQTMATLSEDDRATFRSSKLYRRFLSATPSANDVVHAAPNAAAARWREFAAVSKNLVEAETAESVSDELLRAALALSVAERAILLNMDEHGLPAVLGARSVLSGKDERPTYSRTVVSRVHRSGRADASLDALADDSPLSSASAHAMLLRSVAAVPIGLGSDRFGVLYVDDRLRPAAFNDEELSLLLELAALGSRCFVAVERRRQERNVQRRLEQAEARLSLLVEEQGVELRELRRGDVVRPSTHRTGIIGVSAAMERVLELVERVASSDVPVLITGESGTGKELIARAIHDASPRAKSAFVSENCGALPESLVESTLFGHVRGAFTGAERNRAGLFEMADGGTILLDEVGELSAATQVKFLRALQSGEIRAVGSEQLRHTDVRLIAATNRNLEERVAEGLFREDLYYRLAVITLHVPPLRDRAEDIAPLVAHFVERHSNGRTVRIEPAALSALQRYAWPGNVRQLENEVRRALVLCRDVLRTEHLSDVVRGRTDLVPESTFDVKAQTDSLERRLIAEALKASAGNQTKAAKLLGVSRFGLQKMLKRLRIDLGREK